MTLGSGSSFHEARVCLPARANSSLCVIPWIAKRSSSVGTTTRPWASKGSSPSRGCSSVRESNGSTCHHGVLPSSRSGCSACSVCSAGGVASRLLTTTARELLVARFGSGAGASSSSWWRLRPLGLFSEEPLGIGIATVGAGGWGDGRELPSVVGSSWAVDGRSSS